MLNFLNLCSIMLSVFVMLVVFLLNAFQPNVMAPKMVEVSKFLLYILLSVVRLISSIYVL